MSNPPQLSILVPPGPVPGLQTTAYHARLVQEVLTANDVDLTPEELGRVVAVVIDAMGAIMRAAFHDRAPKRLHALLEELVCFCAADRDYYEVRP